jgi:hypothetical protein
MNSNFPSLIRRYSTFRNDLPLLAVAKILPKSIVWAGADPLQIKMSDEINLCVPAFGFESALADVVVAGRARKGKVVGEQNSERAQILFFPTPGTSYG